MKNLITILAVLLLPALALAQFPNAPSKVVQGRQTTALGTVFHKAGLPAFTPTNWRNDVSVVIDTLTDITWKWSWDASEWQAQGLFFSAVTPPSLTVVSGASHNYTKAIWQGTTGLLSYYDQNTSAWAAIAISDGVGADSVSVLQDSIIALYAGGIELSRDTIGYPEQAGSQTLAFSGDTLSISGGNSVVLPYSSEIADTAAAVRADFPVVTDNQNISLSNDSLSIQRGNTLYLPYGDAIIDTAAAIRGDFPTDTDAQNLSFSNDTISIERGNSISLPYSQNLQDTSIAIRADFPIDTDAQNLSLSNDTLYIERGNNVFLPYAALLQDTAAALRASIEKPVLVTAAATFDLTPAIAAQYGAIEFTNAGGCTVTVEVGALAGTTTALVRRAGKVTLIAGAGALLLQPAGHTLSIDYLNGTAVVLTLANNTQFAISGHLGIAHCTLVADAGTVTLNVNDCTLSTTTLTGNTNLALAGTVEEGHTLRIVIKQDAIGGWVLNWPGATFLWAGGEEGVVPTTANSQHLLMITRVASQYFAHLVIDYAL